MRDICQKRDSDQKNRETLVDWLKKRKDGPPSMISCENIASQSGGFWNGSGPSPSEVAKFLHGIRDAASIEANDLKILVGVRRQDQMLGSRYSEKAETDKSCSQEDFERRVKFILESGNQKPAHNWLYYDVVEQAFSYSFGKENLLMVSQEALASDPRTVIERIGGFCSKNLVDALDVAIERGKISSVNKKSSGSDRWKMGDVAGGLTLSPEMKDLILSHFAGSNKNFSSEMEKNISSFDYLS